MSEKPKKLTFIDWYGIWNYYPSKAHMDQLEEGFHANEPLIAWQEARIAELESKLAMFIDRRKQVAKQEARIAELEEKLKEMK